MPRRPRRKTPKSAIRRAISLFQDDGVKPSGIVINGYQEPHGNLEKKDLSG